MPAPGSVSVSGGDSDLSAFLTSEATSKAGSGIPRNYEQLNRDYRDNPYQQVVRPSERATPD